MNKLLLLLLLRVLHQSESVIIPIPWSLNLTNRINTPHFAEIAHYFRLTSPVRLFIQS